MRRSDSSLAFAKEIAVDTAVPTVLSEVGAVLTLTERTRGSTEAFSQWTTCLALLPTLLGKSLVKRCGA